MSRDDFMKIQALANAIDMMFTFGNEEAKNHTIILSAMLVDFLNECDSKFQ